MAHFLGSKSKKEITFYDKNEKCPLSTNPLFELGVALVKTKKEKFYIFPL